jgi:hypothetical protein
MQQVVAMAIVAEAAANVPAHAPAPPAAMRRLLHRGPEQKAHPRPGKVLHHTEGALSAASCRILPHPVCCAGAAYCAVLCQRHARTLHVLRP